MMTTVLFLCLTLLCLFVFQQGILSIANIKVSSRKFHPVHAHRRIAVFLFSSRMEGNLRQILLQLVHQEYPQDKYTVYLITNDRNHREQFADLAVKVVLTYENTKVGNCRQALQQTGGVYDIAVSIHQPVHISDQYLLRINEGFQQGYYFMQPWLSRADSNCEVVPEPEAGFQSLGMSVPLNNAIYSTPFLWLKQQLEQMKDIENYHHGLQYRLLEQGYSFHLAPAVTASLTEDAISEKKGIINRLQFGLKGFRLLLTGKPSMLFIGIWKCQPHRILTIAGLLSAMFIVPAVGFIAAFYIVACALSIVSHPEFDSKRTLSNFTRQFGQLQLKTRRKRASLSVSTVE